MGLPEAPYASSIGTNEYGASILRVMKQQVQSCCFSKIVMRIKVLIERVLKRKSWMPSNKSQANQGRKRSKGPSV